jgi:hypothetical protein
VPDVVFGSSTALLFSVFRRRTSLSAIACTAVLSVAVVLIQARPMQSAPSHSFADPWRSTSQHRTMYRFWILTEEGRNQIGKTEVA